MPNKYIISSVDILYMKESNFLSCYSLKKPRHYYRYSFWKKLVTVTVQKKKWYLCAYAIGNEHICNHIKFYKIIPKYFWFYIWSHKGLQNIMKHIWLCINSNKIRYYYMIIYNNFFSGVKQEIKNSLNFCYFFYRVLRSTE